MTEPVRRVALTQRTELGNLLRAPPPQPPSGANAGWEELPPPIGEVTSHWENNALGDVFVVLRWKGQPQD